jgi:lipopolysaccharide export system protein LptA
MKCRKPHHPALLAALSLALLAAAPAHALQSDRQQPLDVRADATEGTLGDGMATLRGNVEIRQGTLLIRADVATVEKVEGRVRRFELTGNPVHLQQEIEEEGLVSAEAQKVEYEVATGIVTLTGAADVQHPQYQINGEVLRYDMNVQHFQGSGGDDEGRIRIQLDPEVIPGDAPAAIAPDAAADAPADAQPDAPADAPADAIPENTDEGSG